MGWSKSSNEGQQQCLDVEEAAPRWTYWEGFRGERHLSVQGSELGGEGREGAPGGGTGVSARRRGKGGPVQGQLGEGVSWVWAEFRRGLHDGEGKVGDKEFPLNPCAQ